MNSLNNYSVAELTPQQIEKINILQSELKTDTDEDIILVAYKNNRTAD